MIRTLLVGLGGMGKVHYCNTEALDGVKIVAAVGSTESDKAYADEKGLGYYSTITEALEKEDVGVVDITTPTFLHYAHVKEALENKKHVICEKPLALRKKDAEELYDLAEKNDLFLIVAQVLRFTKEYAVLKELVEKKTFGEALYLRFTRLSECPSWAKGGWLLDEKKSGLVPFDLHIHDLDMIVSLFGKPLFVREYRKRGRKSSIDEYYSFSYSYPGNLQIDAEAAWLNASIPFEATWRAIFEDAMVINDGKNVIAYPKSGERIVYDTSYPVVLSTGINVPPTGWYYEELKSIYSSIRDKEMNIVDKKGIITVLEILENL